MSENSKNIAKDNEISAGGNVSIGDNIINNPPNNNRAVIWIVTSFVILLVILFVLIFIVVQKQNTTSSTLSSSSHEKLINSEPIPADASVVLKDSIKEEPKIQQSPPDQEIGENEKPPDKIEKLVNNPLASIDEWFKIHDIESFSGRYDSTEYEGEKYPFSYIDKGWENTIMASRVKTEGSCAFKVHYSNKSDLALKIKSVEIQVKQYVPLKSPHTPDISKEVKSVPLFYISLKPKIGTYRHEYFLFEKEIFSIDDYVIEPQKSSQSFVFKLEGRKPGIYTFECNLIVSYEGFESRMSLIKNLTWLFDN